MKKKTKANGKFTADREPAVKLRLYVAGQTPKSLAALSNLKRICAEHLDGKYELEVIDLIKNPQLAQGDQILAIPTLVRNLPVPIRKIIGDLSNVDRVLVGLDLRGAWEGIGKESAVSRKNDRSKTLKRPNPQEIRARAARKGSGPRKMYSLRLYITGQTPRSAASIRNLREVCDEFLEGRFELQVIDLYQRPELAKEAQVVAAPTLIKRLPLPLRRLVGDLSNKNEVLLGSGSQGIAMREKRSTKTKEKSAAQQIKRLRARVQELEETFSAIKRGRVDAVVINGADGDQVFTLQGAEHPYRVLVETMNEGAATLDKDGTVLYGNASFAANSGRAPRGRNRNSAPEIFHTSRTVETESTDWRWPGRRIPRRSQSRDAPTASGVLCAFR